MGSKELLCVAALATLCAAVFAGVATTDRPRLLGSRDKVCTWGPGYWCQNITTAKGCGAVRHCIQTVWEHMTLPEDNDDICTTCKKMVAEARDQLMSNQTQEELREVFEGSCNLIPLKYAAEACDKLVDEFVPELVETLASQMNPQVVCAVAGLCNNAEIDRMLAASGKLTRVPLEKQSVSLKKPIIDEAKSDCNVCSTMLHKLQKKIEVTKNDELLMKFLEGCGMLGSFSDGCSAHVVTHFEEIKNFLQQALEQPAESCGVMEYCSLDEVKKSQVNVDIVPVGQVGIRPVMGDDMTCQFCERMVQHLRDILVANTTESEFEQVMIGLCKQMKPKYKSECLSIVHDYYGMFYNFLVNNLNGKEMCSFAGLCPGPGLVSGPIWPLLPAEMNLEALKAQLVGTDEASSIQNPVVNINANPDTGKVSTMDPALQQLPIERMTPHVLINIGSNKEICAFCEYFLHFVQTELADERTEEKVKSVVQGVCHHLPRSLEIQCRNFVDAYGNAFIAILVQEIDPSLVCPGMGFCPSEDSSRIVVMGSEENVDDKPGCPLCLLAVEQLETMVKNNKTEESVKNALESLCTHLRKPLMAECTNFVDAYSTQLIEMLVADFTPQEVCVYIRLCTGTKTEIVSGDVATNEIPQYENQKLKRVKDDPQCVICEFAMSRIDAMLKDNATEEEIKHAVNSVCNHLPKTVVPQCHKFVNQYADLVITLLAQELDPKVICTELKLCKPNLEYSDSVALSALQQHTRKNIEECALCEGVVQALDTYLRDPDVEQDIDELLIRVCQVLPAKQYTMCRNFIKVYGPSIQNIIAEIPGASHLICGKIGVCVRGTGTVNLLGGRKCTWGPGYWCQKEETARACGMGTLLHCQERVWKAAKPQA